MERTSPALIPVIEGNESTIPISAGESEWLIAHTISVNYPVAILFSPGPTIDLGLVQGLVQELPSSLA
jgi:hypothetical protein